MSFDISKFYDPNRGSAMEWPAIGDFIDGRILDVELVPDQFNPGQEVLKAKLAVRACRINGKNAEIDHKAETVVKDAYLRSPGLKDAVGQAAVAAGVTALELGANLRIEYTGDKPLKSGKAMKVYSGVYTPEAGL